MTAIAGKLGMMALEKGGDWLLNKAKTTVEDGVKKLATNTLFNLLSGVKQGSGGELMPYEPQSENPEYRGRENFDWSKTPEGSGGIWHGGRYLSGSKLNSMLKTQQASDADPNKKITLAEFRAMLDKVPDDGSEAKNKGMLRLIRKGDQVVLDKVGASGPGSLFVRFRCNMDDEHNRQVRALFVDSVLEDMKSIFPKWQDVTISDGTVSNMNTDTHSMDMLLAGSKINAQMDIVYQKLSGLLSTKKETIPTEAKGNGKDKAPVLAQKFLRKDVNDILKEYDKIFQKDTIGSVFDSLFAEACDVIGLPGKGGNSDAAKRTAFLETEKFKNAFETAFGKSYDALLTELCQRKSGREIGAQLKNLSELLVKICQSEVVEKEVALVKQGADGVRFQEGSFAHRALQAELVSTLNDASNGENHNENVGHVARFMREIMPYMLAKCRDTESYRNSFGLGEIKAVLTEFVANLGGIHTGEFSKNQTNHKILNAVIKGLQDETKRDLEVLDAKLAKLEAEHVSMDDPNVIDLRTQQFHLSNRLERLGSGLQLAEAIDKGEAFKPTNGSPMAEWLKEVGEKTRNELKEYLGQGFTSTKTDVLKKWMEQHWAQEKFHVTLPFSEDILDMQKEVFNVYADKVVNAIAANYSKNGQRNVQSIIAKLADAIMDKSVADSFAKRMKGVNETQLKTEGAKALQENQNVFVAHLVTSFVDAALEANVWGDVKKENVWTVAVQRAKMIPDKLAKVCSKMMSTWGDTMLARFQRSVNAYFTGSQLKNDERQQILAGFKRALSAEIADKLLAGFAADLADIAMLSDKDFEKALDARLADYQQRAERACQNRSNAIIYDLLGFTLGDGKAPSVSETATVRFEGAENVGKGYVDVNKRFAQELERPGASSVLTADELKATLKDTGASVWVNLVIGNAPGRGNILTEFVATKTKAFKETVKAKLLNLFEDKQAEIPKIVQDIIGFDDIGVVKKAKDLLSQKIETGKIDATWVKNIQMNYAVEMSDRLAKYQGFEKKFLATCDDAIAARLADLKKSETGAALADLGPDELALLAREVRQQITAGPGAIRDTLKDILRNPTRAEGPGTLERLVKTALVKVTDTEIGTAVKNISAARAKELEAALGKPGELAGRLENTLRQTVFKDFGVEGLADAVRTGTSFHTLEALTQDKGILTRLAQWMSGTVQVEFKKNPLSVYRYFTKEDTGLSGVDPNRPDTIVARATRLLTDDFAAQFKGLREAVEAYLKAFPQQDVGVADQGLRQLFGVENVSIPLNDPKCKTVSECLTPFLRKLAAMGETLPPRVAEMRQKIEAKVESQVRTLDANIRLYAGGQLEGVQRWRDGVVAQITSAARRPTSDALTAIVRQEAGIDTSAVPVEARVLKDAADAIELAYTNAAGLRFQHYAEVSKAVNAYKTDARTREVILNAVRATLEKDPTLGFFKETDNPRSVDEHWKNWFANERLQRAVTYVLERCDANIVTLTDEVLADEEDWKKGLMNHVQAEVVSLLSESEVATGNGYVALTQAYDAAVRANSEIRINFDRPDIPSGNLRQAMLDLLDCRMPLGGMARKSQDQVVNAYVDRTQTLAREVLQELHKGFKAKYNVYYESYYKTLRNAIADPTLQGEICGLFTTHCMNVYQSLTGWATLEVINGADTKKMADELGKYFDYDFKSTTNAFLQCIRDTGLYADTTSFSKLLGIPETWKELPTMLRDPQLNRLVASAQKRVWKNILTGFEEAFSHRIRFNESLMNLLSDLAIRPLDADPAKRQTAETEANSPYRWIDRGSKIWAQINARKLHLLMAYGTPQHVVSANVADGLRDMLDGMGQTLNTAYRGFFERHPDYVDRALQAKPMAKGETVALFTNFFALCRKAHPNLKDSCGLSVEALLDLHRKTVAKATKLGRRDRARMEENRKALRGLWERYGDRLDHVRGISSEAGALGGAFAQQDDGTYRFSATDVEIRTLHADVGAEPDDFLEDIAFTWDGNPKGDLVTCIQNVAEDILAADRTISA